MTVQAIKIILNIAIIAAMGYLVFIVVGSLMPYICNRRTRDKSDDCMCGNRLHVGSETIGPDRACIIETPQDALNVRIALVRRAKVTLDITYYRFFEDICAHAVIGEVLQAADRGVRIRILLDGIARGLRYKTIQALQQHRNISFHLYNPPDFFRPWEWHSVLHDKFIIVDGEFLLLGGRNFDSHQFGLDGQLLPLKHDRDVLVWRTKLDSADKESVLEQIQQYNDLLWSSEDVVSVPDNINRRYDNKIFYDAATQFEEANPQYYSESIEDYKQRMVETYQITLLHNPIHTSKKNPIVANQLRKLLSYSKEHVIVQSPFATANKRLLQGISETARRVNFTLLTNSMASSPNFPGFSNYYFQRKKFLNTGAVIYEYQQTESIHGKSVIVDDRISAVGSFNLDDRSAYIDTETMLVIDSPAFVEQMMHVLNGIREKSLKVGSDNRYIPSEKVEELKTSFTKQLLMGIVYLLLRPFQYLI